jgi:hypothetical protein
VPVSDRVHQREYRKEARSVKKPAEPAPESTVINNKNHRDFLAATRDALKEKRVTLASMLRVYARKLVDLEIRLDDDHRETCVIGAVKGEMVWAVAKETGDIVFPLSRIVSISEHID